MVSVIVPYYRENKIDIDITMGSLNHQTYPPGRYEIFAVVEADDLESKAAASWWISRFASAGVRAELVTSDGQGLAKPHALNQALPLVTGEYCAFFDASDRFEPGLLARAMELLASNDCDVVQAPVLRTGPRMLDHYLLLDTMIWYSTYLPALVAFCGGFPLSGEGLFVRTRVLQEVGGFPEELTEDAMLGVWLAEKGKKFAILDQVVVEKAPCGTLAHFRQKRRWFRGFLTCLRRLFQFKLPILQWLGFLVPLSAPIGAGLGVVGWLVVSSDFVWSVLSECAHPAYSQLDVPTGLLLWSQCLFVSSLALCYYSARRAGRVFGLAGFEPLALLLPLYWLFVGVCAISSFFHSKEVWSKTTR